MTKYDIVYKNIKLLLSNRKESIKWAVVKEEDMITKENLI